LRPPVGAPLQYGALPYPPYRVPPVVRALFSKADQIKQRAAFIDE
jgi:hypothetical protein